MTTEGKASAEPISTDADRRGDCPPARRAGPPDRVHPADPEHPPQRYRGQQSGVLRRGRGAHRRRAAGHRRPEGRWHMTNTTDGPAARRLGDAKQVGARTGMSWRTVYRYADAGLMPPGIKIGSLRRWDMDEIELWITGGCRPVRQAGRV